MYVDRSTVRSKSGKSYTRHLLRECYRENGQVKHRTIANLSHCQPAEIEAIRLALRHKGDLGQLASIRDDIELEQGLSMGAVWTVFQIAGELGIAEALGNDRQGKRQIVIGLLCDEQGVALSVEVFEGNTSDPKTFLPQVRKSAERFGVREVTFVGDRGMIKSPQIEQLGEGLHYITAITKPQIESLLRAGVIQMELFDQLSSGD